MGTKIVEKELKPQSNKTTNNGATHQPTHILHHQFLENTKLRRRIG